MKFGCNVSATSSVNGIVSDVRGGERARGGDDEEKKDDAVTIEKVIAAVAVAEKVQSEIQRAKDVEKARKKEKEQAIKSKEEAEAKLRDQQAQERATKYNLSIIFFKILKLRVLVLKSLNLL